MEEQSTSQEFKRKIAYKLRVGEILEGKQIIENERLRFLELDKKEIVRVNVIANIVDKFIQDGEKKFGSITLDDASGQIKVKVFGDEISRFEDLNQGDTILVIGLLRSWNSELYITPEIIKNRSPSYLLLRKLEVEAEQPKVQSQEKTLAVKDKIINMVKGSEKDQGIEIEKIILELKESPSLINQEIKKLLEEGTAYEPRPGKLRYLG